MVKAFPSWILALVSVFEDETAKTMALFWPASLLSCLTFTVFVSMTLGQVEDIPEYYCGHSTYGSPDIKDCSDLLNEFANYQDTTPRVFDEEQLQHNQQGSWPGLQGKVGATQIERAVQMPRIYTRSSYIATVGTFSRGEKGEADRRPLETCNFMLGSHTTGYALHPIGASTWARVNADGNFMITKCILNRKGAASGGVVVVKSCNFSPCERCVLEKA